MMTRKELLEYVNGYWPTISRGKIVALENDKEAKPLPEGVDGYLNEHPEGSDRGGYVPTFETESGEYIHYIELDGEWI